MLEEHPVRPPPVRDNHPLLRSAILPRNTPRRRCWRPGCGRCTTTGRQIGYPTVFPLISPWDLRAMYTTGPWVERSSRHFHRPDLLIPAFAVLVCAVTLYAILLRHKTGPSRHSMYACSALYLYRCLSINTRGTDRFPSFCSSCLLCSCIWCRHC